MQTAAPLFSNAAANAAGSPPAPFLPTSRAEMEALGWRQCDIIIVTGDAYVDHPSFGMAIIGRVLEAQGFKVGIIAQPDWHSTRDFAALGAPGLHHALCMMIGPSQDARFVLGQNLRGVQMDRHISSNQPPKSRRCCPRCCPKREAAAGLLL